MIIISEIKQCPKCESSDIVKNGMTQAGKQKYYCKSCDSYGTLDLEERYSAERKAEILRAYQERSSLRGLSRTFGVARQTVSKWLVEESEALPDDLPLVEAKPDDILELDELWSFVGSKKTNVGSG